MVDEDDDFDFNDNQYNEHQANMTTRNNMRLEKKKRVNLHKIKTTHMWTGIYVWVGFIMALLTFCYFTIFQQNEQIVWIMVALGTLFALYAGWSFVSSDDGGAQLLGQVVGPGA